MNAPLLSQPMPSHVLDDLALSKTQRIRVIETAIALKRETAHLEPVLAGKQLALCFQKPSLRTRVSFTVAIRRLGGDVVEVGSHNTKLGSGEDMQEWAAVLGRMVDGIVARVHGHDELQDMAEFSGVPVINALCDRYHPCQGLADAMTYYEAHAAPRQTVADFYAEPHRWTYVGDGNNVTHSLMLTAASLGVSFVAACPDGRGVDAEILALARAIAGDTTPIDVTQDPREAVADANMIYSDTWESYGQEGKLDSADVLAEFEGFQVDDAMLELAADDVIFLHCLPAKIGQEVTESVLRGPKSVVIDQAENRLWTTQALLGHLFAG